MNATMAKKLRFSDVVYAINGTPKSLRLWLQRGLVDIHTPKPEGSWTEYSFIDIAILVMVRTLVTYGVNVPTASAIANAVMTEFFPKMLHLKNPENMPAGALAVLWHNTRLRVYPVDDGDQWKMEWSPNWDPRPEPAAAYLNIDVETLFRTAFERANESVNEGREDTEE